MSGAMSSAEDKPSRPALWKVWWTAARPHTLTASLSPVIVGCNATLHAIQDLDVGNNFWSLTYQWAWFCMLIQLGTNLHNDYADFVKVNTHDRTRKLFEFSLPRNNN
jgi:1,4-dihydroxy-2-naphthoate octaprenyltransferase